MLGIEAFKAIEKICKPLTTHLPVQVVSYARFYPDGRRICLSNSPDFIHHFVDKNDYFRSVPNPRLAGGLNSMVRIADVNALIVTTDSRLKTLYTNMMSDGVGILKTQPPYSLLSSKPGYFEEFSFFPSVYQVGAYERLISNHDVLLHFTFYFLEKAFDIIRTCEATFFDNAELVRAENIAVLNNCLQTMKTKKYFFDSGMNSYLTRREAQCAYLITKNLSSREIALAMNISVRTAEEYIENIKLKSQLSNKNKLQAFLCKSGFDRMLEFESLTHTNASKISVNESAFSN